MREGYETRAQRVVESEVIETSSNLTLTAVPSIMKSADDLRVSNLEPGLLCFAALRNDPKELSENEATACSSCSAAPGDDTDDPG